jgi:hypothetical protein
MSFQEAAGAMSIFRPFHLKNAQWRDKIIIALKALQLIREQRDELV